MSFPASRPCGQTLLLTLKEGRNSLRCTMGRANAAGACTSRMLTATGYALFTCWQHKISGPQARSNTTLQPFTSVRLKPVEMRVQEACAVRW